MSGEISRIDVTVNESGDVSGPCGDIIIHKEPFCEENEDLATKGQSRDGTKAQQKASLQPGRVRAATAAVRSSSSHSASQPLFKQPRPAAVEAVAGCQPTATATQRTAVSDCQGAASGRLGRGRSSDYDSDTTSRANSSKTHLTKTVYYQNRFFTVSVDPDSIEGQALARAESSVPELKAQAKMVKEEPKKTLLSRAPPAVQRCFAILRDDRMENASPEMRAKMEIINSPPEGDSILRKILNFIFVTTGVVLLLGVVLVVIYTSFGGEQAEELLRRHLEGDFSLDDSAEADSAPDNVPADVTQVPGTGNLPAKEEIVDNIPDSINLHDTGAHDYEDDYDPELDDVYVDHVWNDKWEDKPRSTPAPTPPSENYYNYNYKTKGMDYADQGDLGEVAVKGKNANNNKNRNGDRDYDFNIGNFDDASYYDTEEKPTEPEARPSDVHDVNIRWKYSPAKSEVPKPERKRGRNREKKRHRSNKNRKQNRKDKKSESANLDESPNGEHKHRRHRQQQRQKKFDEYEYR